MPTRIGERITAALSDRKVTAQEVTDLVTTAKAEKKWTSSLKAEVEALLKTKGDQFEPAAKAQLQQFLASTPVRNDVADPTVLAKDTTSIAWNPVQPGGQLFVDDVSYDDVIQGSIGDCYLVSALSALAHVDPKLIKDAIKDNGDGTYTVRFFEPGVGRRPGKPVSITVDDDLAGYAGSSSNKYGHARDSKELWVGVLEKAYAQWKGGFETIGNGGRAGDVLQAITGKAYTWSATTTNPDALFKQIQTASTAHKPMTAGTFGKDSGVDYSGSGVYAWHSYTLMGAVEESGTKYVQLRNPWGSTEPGSDGKNDGIFKMKLDDFRKYYQTVYVGG